MKAHCAVTIVLVRLLCTRYRHQRYERTVSQTEKPMLMVGSVVNNGNKVATKAGNMFSSVTTLYMRVEQETYTARNMSTEKGGTQGNYSSPMASLVLTDSSRL
uniref:Uncharacterized protein n=1 Tax=Timema tahoe TaxID=61484 RepID=A0A7R9IB98_9NEOP|nr:unnamed protein product [Timema tahoe]